MLTQLNIEPVDNEVENTAEPIVEVVENICLYDTDAK